MALVLDAIESLIVAVMESNRGGTGMSATAATLAIPTGRFRLSKNTASLRDMDIGGGFFDCAYEIDWQSDSYPELPNGINGNALLDVTGDLVIGFVYGAASANQVDTNNWATTAANAVKTAKKRAIGIAHRVSQAMLWHEICTDNTSDPKIYDCKPGEPAVRLEDLGDGRLLAVSRYVWRCFPSTVTVYDPTASS